MDIKFPEAKVPDPQAEALGMVSQCRRAMRSAGATQAELDEFRDEALSGDYNHVIQTCMKWVDFG